tara:strand:- start:219 stop:689 length:471 start_codon:yes stop_codon:yes gene_type:complete
MAVRKFAVVPEFPQLRNNESGLRPGEPLTNHPESCSSMEEPIPSMHFDIEITSFPGVPLNVRKTSCFVWLINASHLMRWLFEGGRPHSTGELSETGSMVSMLIGVDISCSILALSGSNPVSEITLFIPFHGSPINDAIFHGALQCIFDNYQVVSPE